MAQKRKPLPKVERISEAEERKKALEKTLAAIEKACGKGTIMRMSDDAAQKDIETVSTGSLTLDLALGVGGLPRGRIIEIYGPESSGKTTLALHIIAEMQKIGGTCAFIDAEHALDPTYADKLHVDMPSLLLSQPNCGEEALEITDALIRSGAVDLVVVDSVAALVPQSEISGEMGDPLPGLQARLLSQALRKITGSVTKTKSMVIFINQIRYKIGVLRGSPETTAGGNALKFYSTVRLDIRRREPIKKDDEIIGNETSVKVVKNKVAPPFKQASFDIFYGKGISRLGEVIDLAVEAGIFEKSGAWYSYGDRKLGQGKDKVRDVLEQEPDFAAMIENKIRTANNIHVGSCLTADEEYEREQALIAQQMRHPPMPPEYPSGRREAKPEPEVRLNDIPVGEPDDALSKEQFEEVLGY